MIFRTSVRETKQLVKEKAKEMGYFPNLAARALKTHRSYNIGVLCVDDKNSALTHPFSREYWRA
ncbi:MAG: hypothetical protein ACLR2E_16655 [Lachnospiraceae bacterium]